MPVKFYNIKQTKYENLLKYTDLQQDKRVWKEPFVV